MSPSVADTITLSLLHFASPGFRHGLPRVPVLGALSFKFQPTRPRHVPDRPVRAASRVLRTPRPVTEPRVPSRPPDPPRAVLPRRASARLRAARGCACRPPTRISRVTAFSGGLKRGDCEMAGHARQTSHGTSSVAQWPLRSTSVQWPMILSIHLCVHPPIQNRAIESPKSIPIVSET